MFFVNQRWLGGLLTNFTTIQRSLARLRELEAMTTDGRYDTLSKKEIARLEKERRKLAKNLDGIRGMSRLPDVIFIVDTRHEQIAVDEARRLKIPVIGVVDTNCDPDQVDYVIPGNDDALRSIRLFAAGMADAVLSGRGVAESHATDNAADAGAAPDTEQPHGASAATPA
jgi:small subunit ribosomal protein S2